MRKVSLGSLLLSCAMFALGGFWACRTRNFSQADTNAVFVTTAQPVVAGSRVLPGYTNTGSRNNTPTPVANAVLSGNTILNLTILDTANQSVLDLSSPPRLPNGSLAPLNFRIDQMLPRSRYLAPPVPGCLRFYQSFEGPEQVLTGYILQAAGGGYGPHELLQIFKVKMIYNDPLCAGMASSFIIKGVRLDADGFL